VETKKEYINLITVEKTPMWAIVILIIEAIAVLALAFLIGNRIR